VATEDLTDRHARWHRPPRASSAVTYPASSLVGPRQRSHARSASASLGPSRFIGVVPHWQRRFRDTDVAPAKHDVAPTTGDVRMATFAHSEKRSRSCLLKSETRVALGSANHVESSFSYPDIALHLWSGRMFWCRGHKAFAARPYRMPQPMTCDITADCPTDWVCTECHACCGPGTACACGSGHGAGQCTDSKACGIGSYCNPANVCCEKGYFCQ
jgi:hypothetical protein